MSNMYDVIPEGVTPMASITVPTATAPLVMWAQWYAAQGWPVFPCRGKKPVIPIVEGGQGYKDASIDPLQIDIWWQKYPDANIGSPAGIHWWALDVDPRSGGDSTLFDHQKQHGWLPRTLMSHTGGGGEHYLWSLPQGLTINNKA